MNIPITGAECVFYLVSLIGILMIVALLTIVVCEFFKK